MNITLLWSPGTTVPAQDFNVLYREYDPNGLNNWILANPTPLPGSTTSYIITGLDENKVYEYGVAMSCVGFEDVLATTTFLYKGCPVVSFYQGPEVLNLPTLFYSVGYPGSSNILNSKITGFDTTIAPAFPEDCPTPTAAVVGRSFFQTTDSCTSQLAVIACGEQTLGIVNPNNNSSALGYFGLDSAGFLGTCGGLATDPLLFNYTDTFKFNIETTFGYSGTPVTVDIVAVDSSCTGEASASSFNFIPLAIDSLRTSAALCWNNTTGLVKVSVEDGTGQTNISDYTIGYGTSDPLFIDPLPLVDNAGLPITSNATQYYVYCPVRFQPELNVAQLSDDMSFELFFYNPSLSSILVKTGLDYSLSTVSQMLVSIAAQITVDAGYTANYVKINGVDYIKINVPGTNIVEAKIVLAGPNILYSSIPDIVQVPPALNLGGVQSAFIYDAGAGDFIYGARGPFTLTAKIEITDIANQSTTEVSHPINFGIREIAHVDLPVPPVAYDITNFNGNDGFYGINQAIVNNAGASWNDGLLYVPGGASGKDINVYDSSLTLVDTLVNAHSVPIRMIEINQSNGYIFVIGDDFSALTPGTYNVSLIDHSSIGNFTVIGTDVVIGANRGYEGSVTGKEVNTVASSTQYTITVAGTPWTNNQWNGYRVEILTGAMAGKQVKLYTYNPPTSTTFSNDTNTLYVEPGPSDPTFDGTSLASGDTFALLVEYSEGGVFFDTNATWTPGEWQNYNVVITDPTSPAAGEFALVQNSGVESLSIKSFCAGGECWDIKLGYNNYGLSHGTTYTIYRYNSGGLKYDLATDSFIYSHGLGQVAQFDGSTGSMIITNPLLNPAGSPLVAGSFQMCHDTISNLYYLIGRDVQDATISDPLVPIVSKDIYIYDPSTFTSSAAIDGSSRWNTNICGNISMANVSGDSVFYFTSRNTRELYIYNLTTNTFQTKLIPSVYQKSQAVELVQGAVLLDSDRLIMMNRLNNWPSTPTIITSYLFTNLFVFNLSTDEIEQVLVGADSTPYSGPFASWNPNSYGEMFAEYMGQKSYGFGGLSILADNGNIYWKQSPELQHYKSVQYNETGVAQIWGTALNSGIVRIWNIQNDGSVVPSVRTLFNHGVSSTNRSLTSGLTNIQYDTTNSRVIGLSSQSRRLDVINTQNLTGAYNGPYHGNYNSFSSRIAIDTTITNPAIFAPDQLALVGGKAYVFGYDGSSVVNCCRVYDSTRLLGSSAVPSQTKVLGDGTNPGVYNVHIYPPVYHAPSNEIWIMGNRTPNTPPPPASPTGFGDRIIAVLDVTTLNQTQTINLTTANAVPIAGTGVAYNHYYCPALDKFVYYGNSNTLLVFVDPTSYQVTFKGNISLTYNFKRVPPIVVNVGWMVPYAQGFFLDYHVGSTEFWTYIVPTTVDNTGKTHNIIGVDVQGNPVVFDDVFSITTEANTFGQWKVNTGTTWAQIPGGGTINILPNEIIEFTMFSPSLQITSVYNVTQAFNYDPATYANQLNSITSFSIKADGIVLASGDELRFEFNNPIYPDCPYINSTTISF